jgi:KDO2-lipid IV(A) lauroyltransferase
LIISKVIGYRKKTIIENLKFSFPKKTESEIDEICEKFYRFFTDMILESIKLKTISKNELEKRIKFQNSDILDSYSEQNQSVVIALGHLGNWEWAGPAASLQVNFVFQAIYKRLLNPYFNEFVLDLRSRLGVELLEMKTAARSMLLDKNRCTATAFPMDQRPAPENAYWTTFLNRDAGFFMGPEKIARKMNYPVIYAKVIRVKRGYYKMVLDEISSDPASLKEGQIIEIFVRKLEQDIFENPESYLWSHKRWKHKRPDNK